MSSRQQPLNLRGGTYAVYSGKCVPMDYITDRRERFKLAAQRVADNAGEGYVIEDTGSVYRIELPSKRAKLVTCIFEAERILAMIGQEAST